MTHKIKIGDTVYPAGCSDEYMAANPMVVKHIKTCSFETEADDGQIITTQYQSASENGTAWFPFMALTTVPPGMREKLMEFNDVFDKLKRKFTSGNDIEVERITVTRQEWDAFLPALEMYKAYICPHNYRAFNDSNICADCGCIVEDA